MTLIIGSTDSAVDGGGAVRAMAQAELMKILDLIQPDELTTAELVSMVTLLRPVYERCDSVNVASQQSTPKRPRLQRFAVVKGERQ